MAEPQNLIPLETAKSQIERRRSPRFQFRNPLIIQSDHLGLHNAWISNISTNGVGISTDSKLEKGDNVHLSSELGPKKEILSINAVVRWSNLKNDLNYYGLEFAGYDEEYVKDILRKVNIDLIEKSIGCKLPEKVKNRYINDWIHTTYKNKDISKIIDFEEPFLKINRVVVFDSFKKGKFEQIKSLSVGKMYLDDVQGHYNNTIFLAKCGQLMGQAASILIGALNPDTAPQVVEVDRIKPILSEEYLWQPRSEGSYFFVESEIIRKKMHVYIVNVHVSFGDILMGKVEGLKLLLTPRNSIWSAKELPPWE